MVYLFECQIKAAYIHKKPEVHTFYEYTKKFFDTDQKINKLLETTIIKQFTKSQKPEENPNYRNQINFYLTKCIDRLKETHDKHEYLIEYNWYYDGKDNQISKIFNKACEAIYEDFNDWKANRVLYELLEEQELQKTAKKNKKSKKNKKNKKESDSQNQENVDKDMIDPSNNLALQEVKKLRMQIEAKIQQNQVKMSMQNFQIKTDSHEDHFIEKQSIKLHIDETKRQKQIIDSKKIQTDNKNKKKKDYVQKLMPQQKSKKLHVVQHSCQENAKKQKKQQISSQISDSLSHVASQISSLENDSKKRNQDSHKNKKIIRHRINEYYQQFIDGLSQQASVFDKYRKLVVKVIDKFIETEILGKQKTEWKLNLYGSAAAEFALKQSDVDLVLQANTKLISLVQIFEILKTQLWAIDCQLIQAQIPLITFGVNLRFSETAVAELQPKQLKRIQGEIFSVDLTLSSIGVQHSGIQNTNQLRELFQVYPPLKTICLLYKEYLRIKNLNKPYKGGISSYVLVMLIYSILCRYKLLSNDKPDYSTQIKEISKFMISQFQCFKTVVSCEKGTKTRADPNLHLNIEDPKTKKLLKTSAFQIDIIIGELQKMGEFQVEMEDTLQKMPANETKNMKRVFFQKLQQVLMSNEKKEVP